MDKLLDLISQFSKVTLRIVELLVIIVALIVLIFILLGETSGAFIVSVIGNILMLIYAMSPQAIVGIAIIIFLWLFFRDRAK